MIERGSWTRLKKRKTPYMAILEYPQNERHYENSHMHVHYIDMSHDYYTFCSSLKTSYDLQTNKIAHLRDVYFPITLCGWKPSLATFS